MIIQEKKYTCYRYSLSMGLASAVIPIALFIWEIETGRGIEDLLKFPFLPLMIFLISTFLYSVLCYFCYFVKIDKNRLIICKFFKKSNVIWSDVRSLSLHEFEGYKGAQVKSIHIVYRDSSIDTINLGMVPDAEEMVDLFPALSRAGNAVSNVP